MFHAHPGAASAPSPRDPEQTLLHRVVREHLHAFLEHTRAADRSLPRFVQRELEDFLTWTCISSGPATLVRYADDFADSTTIRAELLTFPNQLMTNGFSWFTEPMEHGTPIRFPPHGRRPS